MDQNRFSTPGRDRRRRLKTWQPTGLAVPFIAVAALLSAACGGDSSPAATATGTTAVEAVATARATATAVPAATSTPEPPTATATLEPTAVPTATPVPAAPVAAQPTVAPPPAPPVVLQPTPVPPAALPPPVTFNVTAQLIQYNVNQLTARSGASVTVNFRNEDAGVAHDISFSIAGLGHGHTCVGPCTDSYTFVAPAPGTYDFFCTLHMEMTGKFVVTP